MELSRSTEPDVNFLKALRKNVIIRKYNFNF